MMYIFTLLFIICSCGNDGGGERRGVRNEGSGDKLLIAYSFGDGESYILNEDRLNCQRNIELSLMNSSGDHTLLVDGEEKSPPLRITKNGIYSIEVMGYSEGRVKVSRKIRLQLKKDSIKSSEIMDLKEGKRKKVFNRYYTSINGSVKSYENFSEIDKLSFLGAHGSENILRIYGEEHFIYSGGDPSSLRLISESSVEPPLAVVEIDGDKVGVENSFENGYEIFKGPDDKFTHELKLSKVSDYILYGVVGDEMRERKRKRGDLVKISSQDGRFREYLLKMKSGEEEREYRIKIKNLRLWYEASEDNASYITDLNSTIVNGTTLNELPANVDSINIDGYSGSYTLMVARTIKGKEINLNFPIKTKTDGVIELGELDPLAVYSLSLGDYKFKFALGGEVNRSARSRSQGYVMLGRGDGNDSDDDMNSDEEADEVSPSLEGKQFRPIPPPRRSSEFSLTSSEGRRNSVSSDASSRG